MPERKKIQMAFRSNSAFCMVDPEEPKPQSMRPLARIEDNARQSPNYQTNARVVKGHYRRSGS